MAEFKEGDVVELKSGGPSMTVESIDHEGKVCCTWFIYANGNYDKVERHFFKPSNLKKSE